MDYGIYAGDTDKTIYLRLRDSTTGLAKTGLAYNSAGAVCSYTLPRAARAAITLATQTVTGAHSDGGFVEVDATNCKGLYRLDLPDAAIASGAFTCISIEFDGVIEETVLVPLHTRKVDMQTIKGQAVTCGASVTVGAYVGGTGAAALEATAQTILTDTNELQADWANGGRLDLILDARASQTSVDAIAVDGSLPVTMADGVTHGGTSAMLRLGSTTSTPAFYVTNSGGHGVQFESSQASSCGLYTLATGTSGIGFLSLGSGTSAIGAKFQGNGGVGFYVLSNSTTASMLVQNSTTGDGITVAPGSGGDGVKIGFSGGGTIDAILSGSVAEVLGGINTTSGTITTLDALDTAQDAQHATTQGKIDTVDGIVDAILLDTAEIGAAGAGLSAVPWNAAWDAEVQSEVADGLAAFWTSPATLVDLVWDELLSGHADVGSTGAALSAAGGSGDPWSTALPGAYGAGTAGYILGTNLDATVSSRSSQTSVDTVDGIVDAILLDTNDLQTNQGNWVTATGFSTLTQADIRTAVGLASANLDTQLADLPTVAEFEARTLVAANYATAAALAAAQVDLDTITDTGVTCVALTSAAITDVWSTDTLTESYAANGAAGTPAQMVYAIQQYLTMFGPISGTTYPVKKLDGTTTAFVVTLNDDTTPTAATRS
jgi:hypothetical protein